MSKKKCIYCGKWFKSLGLASHRAAWSLAEIGCFASSVRTNMIT